MQDAYIDNWTQQSHVSSEQLSSMRDLNRRFLDLAGCGRFSPGVANQVAILTPAQRAAAADCPYALFDLRFDDDSYWRARLQVVGTWRIADEPKATEDMVDFVRIALFYTWHLASSADLAAHLLLGMQGQHGRGLSRYLRRGVAIASPRRGDKSHRPMERLQFLLDRLNQRGGSP